MKCTLSDPLVLDENGEITQPTDNSQPFSFGSINCEIDESSSDFENSYLVDISDTSSLSRGLSDYFHFTFIFQAISLFIFSYFIGYSFFKRN